MSHKMAILDKWCEVEGRDPADVERSAGVPPHMLEADLADADAYADMGVQEFTLGIGGPDFDLSAVPQWLEWRGRTNERLSS